VTCNCHHKLYNKLRGLVSSKSGKKLVGLKTHIFIFCGFLIIWYFKHKIIFLNKMKKIFNNKLQWLQTSAVNISKVYVGLFYLLITSNPYKTLIFQPNCIFSRFPCWYVWQKLSTIRKVFDLYSQLPGIHKQSFFFNFVLTF